MYYSSAEIDEELKCAYCKAKFLDVVKIVSSCGESICGECYEELKENVDERGEFKCKACETSHKMPENGLTDNRSLSRMLKRSKIEKPLSEEAKTLKRRVEALSSQLKELEAFDDRNHIQEYCNQLEVEIIEEIDSLVNLLNDIQEDLVRQTREYCKQCLDSLPLRTTSQGLDALSKEIDQFYQKWQGSLSRADVYSSERDVNTALNIATGYEQRISDLNARFKEDAFKCGLMTFQASHSFFDDPSSLRKLFSLQIQGGTKKNARIEPNAVRTLTGHSDKINSLQFLPGDQLASCSDDTTIKVWNVPDGALLYELQDHKSSVNSLALLSNGWLASGSLDATIKLWDLEQRREFCTLHGHTGAVVSLQTFKNGNMASYSVDDTIRVWDQLAEKNNLLFTISGHGNTNWLIPLGVLPNDENLVTISRDDNGKEECILRVWNAGDGRLVKAVPTGLNAANTMLVLSDGRIALSFSGGTIKVVDLANESQSKTKSQAHDYGITALIQLPNGGNLVSIAGDHDAKAKTLVSFKIWSLPGLQLLQTIRTDHTGIIHSMVFSPKGELLATGSRDKTIKLWSISAK